MSQIDKRIKVNTIIENQLPEFVLSDFPNAAEFLKQYYISQEFQGGTTDLINNLDQYLKVDNLVPEVVVGITTISTDVSTTDTTITVGNATTLDDPGNDGAGHVPGVIYIGNERITYEAIDGNNLLFCTRGTLGTSAIAHTNGDTVVNSGASTRIPTVAKFSHYGNGLRLAYNDSGMSLTEHVAVPQTPEHRFIRNAGKGTI